ncbi:MAG: T9SS type A sorting domain-containing protein [Bacteroidales bacterium]|nr:T9SS type A sorting domain-containing protein [Bacteroidales bacterium]
MNSKYGRFLAKNLAVIFILFISSFLNAATITSTTTGGNWTTGASWVGGNAPTTTDIVIIATTGTNKVTLNSNSTCASLTVNSGGSLSIGSKRLTVSGGVSNAGSITASNGRITQSGTANFSNTGTITFTGSGRLYFTGSLTNSGTLTLASTRIYFTGTNAAASTVSAFTTTGTVTFQRTAGTVTFAGNVRGGAFSINGTGGTLNLGTSLTHTFTGAVTISAGTINGGSSTLNANFLGTVWNFWGGTYTAGTGTVNFGGTGNQTITGIKTATFNNLTLSGSGTKTLSRVPIVNGILSMEGTALVSTTPTYGAASTIQYKGTSSRTVSVEFPNTFAGTGGVIIDQGTNTVTLNANKTTLKGNLNIKSGTFNLSTFTVNRSLVGGTLTVANAATLKIGGTNSLPSNYTTHSIGCTSTIEYAGTAQTVAVLNSAQSYGNLKLSGSGIKTLQVGMTSICNDFTLSGTVSATNVVGLTIGGSVDIQAGTTYTAGAFTHNIGRNWTKNGTFGSTNSTINFNGANTASIGTCNFNNITFSGAGTKTATGALSLTGNILISNNFAAGSASHTVAGDWTNNGSFTAGTSTITFNNTVAKVLQGTSSTAFYNLTINGVGGITLGIVTSVSGLTTLTSGILTIGNHNLISNSISVGSSSAYVKTNGTGVLKRQISAGVVSPFPVGNTAYNPVSITNTTAGNTDYYSIRVIDAAITNSNDNAKMVNRRWQITEDVAGGSALTVAATYNAGEPAGSFNASITPFLDILQAPTGMLQLQLPFQVPDLIPFSSAAGVCASPDLTSPIGFFCLGSGDAFSASKFAISGINPTSPFVNQNNVTVTVQTLNSNNVLTAVSQNTGFDLSATNTSLSGTPSGTLTTNNYSLDLTGVMFTTTSVNATVTATRTSGDVLSAGTSGVFSVVSGNIYKPSVTGNWNTVQWEISTDGGVTYANSAVPVDNIFSVTDVIYIPTGITLSADVTATFYNMKVEGTLDLLSGSDLTLNHSGAGADYGMRVLGIFQNSGGIFTNSNTAYPIVFEGGTYNHAMNGGSIPVGSWLSASGNPSTCIISGISSTAVATGLNQHFQNFTWNNASQTVVQNLSSNLLIDGALTLTNGVITTGGSYHVIITASGSVASANNARIHGNVRRYVPNVADPTIDFPIGDAANYTPASVVFSGTIAGSGYLDANTDIVQPPTASGLSQTKYINREWTITNVGVSGFTSYSPTFSFVNTDKIGTPNTSALVIRELIGTTWATTVVGTQAANSTQCSGLTGFGTFAIAEDICSATSAVWFGGTSTNWNTASNWCGGSVPSATVDAYIPAGASNQPEISSAVACKDISIETGASLTMSGSNTLNVYGNWTLDGNFDSGSGTVMFTGATAQSISGVTSFFNLTINNAAGVTANDDVTVTSLLYLQSDNASTTKGALDMGINTMNMGESSTIIGLGDVTGITSRTHDFLVNVPYRCGHENSFIIFSDVSDQILPTTIAIKVTLGSEPDWNSGNSLGSSFPITPLSRIYDVRQVGGSGTSALMRVHYRDDEVQGGLNETKLALWHRKLVAPGVFYVLEVGKSNFDAVDNFLTIQDIDLVNIPSNWGEQQEAIAPSQAILLEWTGANDTDWNNSSNWEPFAIPSADYIVLIPDAASTPNSPTLPTGNDTCVSIIIETGGILNSALDANLVLVGSDAVWTNELGGVFNYGNSTITVANTVSYASFVGSTDFYNITIADGAKLRPAGNSYTGILGTLSISITGEIDAVPTENTFEFKGTNQSIPNPNGSTPGYHNLIVSGTGTKTLPAILDIADEFTNNGTIDAGTGTVNLNSTYYDQVIGGSSVSTFYNLTIDNVYGVTMSNDINIGNQLSLISTNPTVTQGTLNTDSHILTMLNNSTTIGDGEVTGFIKRTSFELNTVYTFGNPNTTITFTNAVTFPSEMIMKISIGASPLWKPTAINRMYDLIQFGGNNCWATARTHYLDPELNGIAERELTYLTNQLPGIEYEWGHSNYDLTENWIELANINLADFPSAFGNMEVALSQSTASSYTWNGAVSNDWNTYVNWTPEGVPIVTSSVKIPNAATTSYSPTLPATTDINNITIDAGAVVNGGTGTTITVTGASGAWNNIGGTFNAGTSTVIFDNNGVSDLSAIATFSGETDFYNVTISNGGTFILQDGSVLRVAGSINTNAGTGLLRTVIGGATTVEYNGGDQNVIIPNPATNRYYNLVLSGSGTKTMPSVALEILGDFTLSGTAIVEPSDAMNIVGDMSINSGSTFSAGNLSHTFAADFTNEGTFNCETSTVTFNGTAQQIIISGGDDFYNIVFDNSTATMTFDIQDPLTIANNATFVNGIITTSESGSVTFNAGAAVSGASETSYVEGSVTKIGNTAFTFPVGNDTYYAPIGISAADGGGNATDYFTAQYIHSDPTLSYNGSSLNALDHVSKAEYWILDRTGTNNVSVTTRWDSIRSGQVTDMSTLGIAHWDGTQWDNAGNVSTTGTTAAGTITSGLMTSFSPITNGSSNASNPLPISLTLFEGYFSSKTSVMLKWYCASEINNDYFTLERSTNLQNWEHVANIKGAGTSSVKTSYAYEDLCTNFAETIFYRLSQTDYDGRVTYFDIIDIYYNEISNEGIIIYPNPIDDILTISYSSEIKKTIEITITDVTGKTISTFLFNAESGMNFKNLNLSNLNKGSYLLHLIEKNKSSFFKIIKQ